MADCAPTATATLYGTTVRTDSSLVVVTSQSVGTSPPRTRTITQSACTSSLGDVCLGYSTTEVVTVVPGSETTRDVLITSYDIVTAADTVPTTTLYAQCQSSNTDQASDPPPTQTSSSAAPNNGNSNNNNNNGGGNNSRSTQADATGGQSAMPTDATSISGMSVYTSIVYVTMPDGAVSSSATVATTTPTLWANGDLTNHDSKLGGGAIAGAVVGSLVGVGLIGCLLFLIWKRRRRWETENYEVRSDHSGTLGRKRSMNLLDEEPKPYQYGVVGAQTPPHTPSAAKTGYSHGHARSVPNIYNPSLLSSQSLDLSSHSHSPLFNPNPSPTTINRSPSRSSRPKSMVVLPKTETSSLAGVSARTSAEEDAKQEATNEVGEKTGSSFVVVRKPRSQLQALSNSNPNNGQQPSSVPPVPPVPAQKKTTPVPAPQPDFFADWQMANLSGGLRLALTNPDIITDNDP